MRLIAGLLWLFLTGAAYSQTAVTPPAYTGCGVVSATNASALVSTMTMCPTAQTNVPPWPSTPQMVYVINSEASAGALFVCPNGGTCTSGGIRIPASQAYGFLRPSAAMTVIAATTATVTVQW